MAETEVIRLVCPNLKCRAILSVNESARGQVGQMQVLRKPADRARVAGIRAPAQPASSGLARSYSGAGHRRAPHAPAWPSTLCLLAAALLVPAVLGLVVLARPVSERLALIPLLALTLAA